MVTGHQSAINIGLCVLGVTASMINTTAIDTDTTTSAANTAVLPLLPPILPFYHCYYHHYCYYYYYYYYYYIRLTAFFPGQPG